MDLIELTFPSADDAEDAANSYYEAFEGDYILVGRTLHVVNTVLNLDEWIDAKLAARHASLVAQCDKPKCPPPEPRPDGGIDLPFSR